VLFTDVEGNVITDGLLTTDGVPVTLLTAAPGAPVPEPSDLGLIGLCAAFGVRRFRLRRDV
jgi:hypothetical protein